MARLLLMGTAGAAALALVLPPEGRVNHLPGCLFAGGRAVPRATSATPVRLRVASIPRTLSASDEPTWVFTVVNRRSRPRSLRFADSAFAEVQLWRNGRRVYSWYDRNIHQPAAWARVVPARRSWSCVQRELDPLGVEPGRYTLVAFLRTIAGTRPRIRKTIVVR
jgi:Intracellular proteinase inhibitor